ncbi:MAG: YbjN domain-containing protein [Rhodospirillaceae bacterium]|nr:YbjN domain-containing protein [Rhodospirillaceae bacterium]
MLRYALFAAALAFAVPAAAGDNPVPGAPDTGNGPAPAQQGPQIIEALTADEMADVIREAGYKAQVKMDSNNEPYIDSKASGLNFWVYLYRCDGESSKCMRVQFQSSFSTNKEQQDKAVNWNVDKVIGRSYNIKDSTYFDYVIDMDGGVTRDNLIRNVELWDTVMGEFTRYIGW